MLSSFIIVSNVGFEDVHLEVHLSGPDGCWWATSLVSGSGWLGFVVKHGETLYKSVELSSLEEQFLSFWQQTLQKKARENCDVSN